MTVAVKQCLLGTSCMMLLLGSASIAHATSSEWTQVGTNVWTVAQGAIYRTQGMAADGPDYYFSWQYGLQKTDGSYNVLTSNSSYPTVSGIPTALSSLGYNHIGDIDYANGRIYASLDSSTSGYNTYNASTLAYTGTYYTLSAPDGTHDIASWIAVGAKNGLAYGMGYDNATEMEVYDLATFKFERYIQLSQSLDSVQGGKLDDGWMYMSSNDSSKSVYRVNLLTGEVQTLFSLKQDYDQEVEGLSVTDTANGPELNVLVINDPDDSGRNLRDPKLNVTLYHYEMSNVPEPGSIAMVLAGLGMLGATRLRKERRANRAVPSA